MRIFEANGDFNAESRGEMKPDGGGVRSELADASPVRMSAIGTAAAAAAACVHVYAQFLFATYRKTDLVSRMMINC